MAESGQPPEATDQQDAGDDVAELRSILRRAIAEENHAKAKGDPKSMRRAFKGMLIDLIGFFEAR